MDAITLDARAAENGLAMMIAGLIEEKVTASDRSRRDFHAMSSTFGLVAPDVEVTVTLRFEGGRCVIYDGLRDRPDLVITADTGRIPELSLISLRYGIPWLFDEAGKSVVAALISREIRIQGLLRLSPTPLRTARAALDLFRLTRILAAQP
jgi:hypothetical protein